MAFVEIVYNFALEPSLPSIVEMVCQKREERIEIVTFSWKRPNFGYDSVWLHYYHAASRCLSMHSTSIISAIMEKRRTMASLYSHDFSHFEDILACCR